MSAALDLYERFVRSLPKAEVHVHLEGAFSLLDLLTLAKENGVGLPGERVTWRADTAAPDVMPAAVEAKLFANEVAVRTAATALQLGGGGAYLMRSPIQRLFRDAQAGALMAYSVPFARTLVGGWALGG